MDTLVNSFEWNWFSLLNYSLWKTSLLDKDKSVPNMW